MASEEELIAIRVALKNAAKTVREAEKVAGSIDEMGDEAEQTARRFDNMGDQAAQAARKIALMNASASSTRVNLGPFTTSMRGGALAIGGLVLLTEKATPAVLSLGEAITTLAGGAGAGAGVGLLALYQGTTVAKLGLADLTEALGGSEEAARKLSPEAYELFRTLADAKQQLKDTAGEALLPGLTRGGNSAMRNFKVLNGLVRGTGKELGRLAGDAGDMLGSDAWGADLKTVGKSNVRIIGDLGDAGLHLADAARHIIVEAGPLAEWLAANAKEGALLVEIWAENARRGGDLRRFFSDARTDLRLFGASVGNVTDALGNLFGNQDVSGTRFLDSLEQATRRFEDWTNSPAVREDFGAAIRKEVADGVGAAAGAAAETLPAAAGRAAEVFWQSFWSASPEGKAFIAIMTGAKIGGAIRGQSRFLPLYVKNVNGVPDGGDSLLTKARRTATRGGGAATAARVAAGGASVALPAGIIAALVAGNNEDFPSGPGAGGTRHGREQEGRPSRDNRGAFERVPDPGERGFIDTLPRTDREAQALYVESKLMLDGEVVARGTGRATAKRRARRGG